MSEAWVYGLLFGGGPMVLALATRTGTRVAAMFALALSALAVLFRPLRPGAPPEEWGEAAVHGMVFGLAALAPFLWERERSREQGVFLRRHRMLSARRARAWKKFDHLRRERRTQQKTLEGLQNRFTMVRAMAAKLEAGDILQTLGRLWMDIPWVRGCLLLRRPQAGVWTGVFSEGLPAEGWAEYVNDHPTLSATSRIRRLPPGEGPARPGVDAEAFLVIPFSWERDLLALGIVAVEADALSLAAESFNLDRRLAAVGLRRAHLYDRMTERSRHDALTGAFLRRSFTERVDELIRNSLRYQTAFFFALVDIDNFKEINDARGHLWGDRVLMHFAQTVRRLALPGVTLGRFGGDEFAVGMEVETFDEALAWLEQLRRAVHTSVLGEEPAATRYTVSVGMTSFLPDRPSLQGLLARADEALYQAKNGGRNRVVCWRPPPGVPSGKGG
jgi:diguanylate cyclase (GGDEF)-like protein